MYRFLIFSTLVLLLINARQAIGHPGHRSEQLANTPAHYLFDPFHAIWTIGMVAALVVFSRPARRVVAAQIRVWDRRSQ